MARQPLGRPRPLPAAVRPLEAAFTGRTHRVRVTTGAATRRALRAAGARAATTGATVHLPSPPSSQPRDLGVLAHELSHVAEHTGGPRFLLDGHAGDDRGERRALQVGRVVEAAARSGGGGGASVDVHRLPVGGVAGLAGVLRQSADGQPGGVMAPHGTGASEGAGAPLGRGGPGAPALLLQRAGAAATVTAPPVGAVSAPTTGSGPATTDGSPGHEPSVAGGPAPSDAAPASPAGGANPSGLLPDLVEALEERVLAELERRGGRYAGVF